MTKNAAAPGSNADSIDGWQCFKNSMENQLLGKFLASLDLSDQGAGAPNIDETQESVRRFVGGALRHEPGLDVHEEGGDLCLSCGEPRFIDVNLSDRARTHGCGAAWLTALKERGTSAPSFVRGRFAAVLIQPKRRKVLAVTDRFATFSVCYSSVANGIRIGDRADDVAGSGPDISSQSLFNFLFYHVIPAPTTVFAGVSRVPAGHSMEWRQGTTTCKPYWTPKFARQSSASLEDQEARFLDIVESAVAREAENGNVGAFLSGGTDSSTIAGMLCKVMGKPAKTYSIGFDASGYDEMEYARIAARHFGADHNEYYVTPEDLLEGIPKVAVHYDQPFGNSSSVPAWVCATRARSDGLDRVLAGDGGDELFGGNERYAKQRVFEQYALIPKVLRRYAFEPVSKLSGIDKVPLLRKAASYVQQSRVPLPDRLYTYNLLFRIGVENVLDPSFLESVDMEEPFTTQRRWWDDINARSSVDHMIAYDWKYTLADNDLPKVIGTAELAGLDVGFPLMSDELLEFSMELPPEWKLKGQTLRWFFKHALRDFLPEEVLRKQKHGFGLPFGVWACDHTKLQELARDSLGTLGTRGIVKPQFVKVLLDEYLPAHPGYYGEMVWILMMLEIWLQSHAPEWRTN